MSYTTCFMIDNLNVYNLNKTICLHPIPRVTQVRQHDNKTVRLT